MAYSDPQVERVKRWAARAKVGAEIVYFTTPPGTGEYENPPAVFAAARSVLAKPGFTAFQRRVWHGPGAYAQIDYTLRRSTPAALKALATIAKIKPERASYEPR